MTARGHQKGNPIEINPYVWRGPYAEMRDSVKGRHETGLCAEARASWMAEGERLILRTSEIVGYETGYFYDDHLPTFDPQGRGKDYHHIPFCWNPKGNAGGLSADCVAPGKGKFWLRLRPQADSIDIELGLRSEMPSGPGDVDWAFCVVGFDSPSIGDAELKRTFLFDGQRLRALRDMSGAAKCDMYAVAGGHGFMAPPHRNFPRGPVEAKASVVIVESVDGKHAAALGFRQSYCIFSNPQNKCFHSDPYFVPLDKRGDERTARGRLYLVEGTAQDAFERYKRDFI